MPWFLSVVDNRNWSLVTARLEKLRLPLIPSSIKKEFHDRGETVYCIYVACGQKASTVAQVAVQKKMVQCHILLLCRLRLLIQLRFLQFCSICRCCYPENFQNIGRRHWLYIYDDLSKQAVAYRRYPFCWRPPGREAYPVTYSICTAAYWSVQQKSSTMMPLLEYEWPSRIFKNSGLVKGGGSLTALPIVRHRRVTYLHTSRPTWFLSQTVRYSWNPTCLTQV